MDDTIDNVLTPEKVEEDGQFYEDVPDDFFPAEEVAVIEHRVPTVYGKLVKLMQEVGVVPKDKVNDYQHYRYASATATMEKVQAGLIKLGLSVTEHMTIMRVDVIGEKRIPNYIVRCRLTLTDMETGDDVDTAAFGSGMDTGDKGIMKAQTAARKYAWWGLLCVGTPDDPEADTATDALASRPIASPTSASAPQGDQFTKAKVLGITQDAPNRPYTISTDHGEFKTFDKNVAASAEIARSTDLEMEIEWRQNPNPRYNDRLIISRKPKE